MVREAEKRILANTALDKEYLPMSGLPEFCKLASQLLYGEDEAVLSRVACIQTLSGTGALRVAGEFLKVGGGTVLGWRRRVSLADEGVAPACDRVHHGPHVGQPPDHL